MPMSEYVRGLRDKVGSQLLLMPSVAVMARDDENRLLLVRHTDSGLWGTVGGAMDPGETPVEAGRRECAEETGLDVELGSLLGVVGGDRFVVEYANGDRVAYVANIFDARVVGGRLRPDGLEVDDARWFTRTEIAGIDLNNFARNLFVDMKDVLFGAAA